MCIDIRYNLGGLGVDDRKDALKSLLIRFLIALPFLGVSIYLMIPISARSVPGVFLLIPVGILIGKPLAALLTSSASSILFPGSAGSEVNLMFSIPESRIMDGQFDEALVLYKEMIPRDPQRLEVYLRIMKLAIDKMKQPEIARDAFRAGLRNLKNLKDRKTLASVYKELMNP